MRRVTAPGGLVRHYQHERDTPAPDRRRDAERVLEGLRSMCRVAQAHDQHDEHATFTGFLELAAGLHSQEVDAATDPRVVAKRSPGAGDREDRGIAEGDVPSGAARS